MENPLSRSQTNQKPGVLYNLKVRFLCGKPYTRAGKFMVAVNPYHWYPELYDETTMKEYADAYAWNTTESQAAVVEPHIYEVSSKAYSAISANEEGTKYQSILALGVIGSSKTESIKLCMNHLIYLQNGPRKSTSPRAIPQNASMVQVLLAANPALEAFGHAATRCNKNSSRYGKYIELKFVSPTGEGCPQLTACEWSAFALERRRVVQPREGERNFHIFYQLLGVPDKKKSKYWEGIQGKTAEDFAFLQTDTEWEEIRDGMSDSKCFKETLDSMAIIGIDKNMRQNLMRALCVIMQLGNLQFEDDEELYPEGCKITSENELTALANLMGVPEEKLRSSLTAHKVIAGGTVICRKAVSAEVAQQGRDALAMEIYDRLFSLILHKINEATGGNDETDKICGKIGLLDAPGFEQNGQNGLDQLCINFISEKFHHKYLEVVLMDFKTRIDNDEIEYIAADVKFQDNSSILSLIDGQTGVMAMLNEATRSMGTYDKFLSRVVQTHRKSSSFVPAKSSFTHEFGIRHTAATVTYQVKNFVCENSTQVPVDLLECIGQCSNDLIVQEFKKVVQKTNNVTTMLTRTKKQMSDVWTRIGASQTNFIQCIQPNDMMRPKIMLHVEAVNQLRAAHVVEALKLRRIASEASAYKRD